MKKTLWVCAVLFSFSLSAALTANPRKFPHVEVGLISESDAFVVGETHWWGVYFHPESEWHTYWENPGDSGEPPRVKWQLPEGVEAGEILWPIPDRIPVPPLTNLGYSGEHLLLVPLKVSESFSAKNVAINAKVSWLVCKEECIPGKGEFLVTLPVRKGGAVTQSAKWSNLFSKSRERLPSASQASAKAQWSGNSLRIEFLGLRATPTDVFAKEEGAIELASQPKIESGENRSWVSLETKSRIHEFSTLNLLVKTQSGAEEVQVGVPETAGNSLALLLLFAFVGGAILNLMPCVLPVLALKVFHLAKEDSKKVAWPQAIGYTFGVLFSMWVLAGTLRALRAGGEALGWGFQLQSPLFLIALVVLFLIMSLNFLGVFEWGSSVAALAGNWKLGKSKSDWVNEFFSGLLAVIVATPCTAPFMGVALGAALTLPAWQGFAIFSALGFGLAVPFAALLIFPACRRFLPKPGAWMVTLRQLLAFPLLLTAAWLLSVLAKQTDVGWFPLLAGLITIGAGFWFFGLPNLQRAVIRYIGVGIAVLGIVVSVRALQSGPEHPEGWQPFSQAAVDEAVAAGDPVFIDFTASWCISCQVNKQLVLDTAEIQEAFKKQGVRIFIADWTEQNAEITKALESHGRSGVPLYVYYSGKPGASAELLPQILTKDLVKKTIGLTGE